MSAGNIAYLALVLAGYAVFMIVLGFVWLRAMFVAPKRPDVAAVASAREAVETPAVRRRAA